MQVHPEFDIETRTWFVPGYRHEAPTIRELLGKLSKFTGKRMTAKDYFTVENPMPKHSLGTKTAEDFMRKPDHIAARSAISLPRFVKPETQAQSQEATQTPEKSVATASDAKHSTMVVPIPHKNLDTGSNPVASTKEMTGAERNSLVLDMWFFGKSIAEIVAVVGGNPTHIASRIVYKARLRGDPRAIYRGRPSWNKKY